MVHSFANLTLFRCFLESIYNFSRHCYFVQGPRDIPLAFFVDWRLFLCACRGTFEQGGEKDSEVRVVNFEKKKLSWAELSWARIFPELSELSWQNFEAELSELSWPIFFAERAERAELSWAELEFFPKKIFRRNFTVMVYFFYSGRFF